MRVALLALLLATNLSLLQAAERPLNIMPLGDSITAAADPGYRGFLYRMLVDSGHAVHFVGTQSGKPSQPEGVALEPDHEGHGGFSIGPGPSLADGWTNGKGNLYANLDDWLGPAQAKTRDVDIILLHVGVNDFANIKERDPGYDLVRDLPTRYAGLVDRILALHPKVAIIMSSIIPGGNPDINAVFPVGPFDQVNPRLKDIATHRASHVFFFDGAALEGTGLKWEPADWNKGDVVHPNGQGQKKFATFWFTAIKTLIDQGRLPKQPYVKRP